MPRAEHVVDEGTSRSPPSWLVGVGGGGDTNQTGPRQLGWRSGSTGRLDPRRRPRARLGVGWWGRAKGPCFVQGPQRGCTQSPSPAPRPCSSKWLWSR